MLRGYRCLWAVWRTVSPSKSLRIVHMAVNRLLIPYVGTPQWRVERLLLYHVWSIPTLTIPGVTAVVEHSYLSIIKIKMFFKCAKKNVLHILLFVFVKLLIYWNFLQSRISNYLFFASSLVEAGLSQTQCLRGGCSSSCE